MLTFFAYYNSFHGELQFDDEATLAKNLKLKYGEIIFNRVAFLSYLYGNRFIADITFGLNYYYGGFDVRWYHITNFLIHLFNGILIFYLVLLTMRSSRLPATYRERSLPVALISSAVFLLHPIQTQAVSYISQRYESLASFFYLCSLLAYIKARLLISQKSEVRSQKLKLKTQNSELRTHRLKPAATRYALYAVSIISGILALGSKEIAITIPVIILLYDFYFLEDRPFLKRITGPGVFIILSLIAGVFMLIGFSRGIEAGFSVRSFTPLEYLMTQFRVLTTYIRLIFLPVNQNLDYDFRVSKSLLEIDTLLSLLFILILIAAAIISFRRWRLGSFFILWFFIILAPTSSIIPIIDPIFEHRVYLASAGIFIIVSDMLSRWILMHPSPSPSPARGEGTIQQLKAIYQEDYPPIPPLLKGGISEVSPHPNPLPQGEREQNNPPPLRGGGEGEGEITFSEQKYNRIAVCVVIILMVLLTAATFQRNRVWVTKLSLWEDAARKSPMKARVHNDLGFTYQEHGRINEAVQEYKTALRLNPYYAIGHNNLGLMYYEQGQMNEAISKFKTAIMLNPDYAEAHNNLGNAYNSQGRTDEAIREFGTAIRLKPDYAEAHNNIGLVYMALGLSDKAILHYQYALRLNQNLVRTHNNLGLAYKQKGLINEAMQEFQTALRIQPDFIEARRNLESLKK